jgi:hypothetical protein
VAGGADHAGIETAGGEAATASVSYVMEAAKLLRDGESKMDQEQLHHLPLSVGLVLLLAGIVGLFLQSIEMKKPRRREVRTGLTWRNWSLRRLWIVIVLACAGTFLVLLASHG